MGTQIEEGVMRATFLRGVVLGSVTAALVLSASAALAGTGVGGIFNLGKTNTVDQSSSLTGSSSGSQLVVSNISTSSGTRGLSVSGASSAAALFAHNGAGPAAAFMSSTGTAPFTVNSSRRVLNLNADMVDGLHGSSLVKGGGWLVSNHRTLAVGTTFSTILTLPGIGAIQASCATPGPNSYFNFLDGSSTKYDATWDVEGAGPGELGGSFGFTTDTTTSPRGSTVVLYDASKASGPVIVVRLWEFPGAPDSSHCDYQAVATVQS
jgi:hypothetical protein